MPMDNGKVYMLLCCGFDWLTMGGNGVHSEKKLVNEDMGCMEKKGCGYYHRVRAGQAVGVWWRDKSCNNQYSPDDSGLWDDAISASLSWDGVEGGGWEVGWNSRGRDGPIGSTHSSC